MQHSIRRRFVKRAIDIRGSLVGLIIIIPVIAIVAIPLKLESPGPLSFKQKRVGLNGCVFEIYKLRSMYKDAEKRKSKLMAKNEMYGLMFKMSDDPRITKVGKFIRKTSIDELTQFWNVLCGDMSLVGTRPPTIDEYAHYESHRKRRLSMKPGITGMWQVSGRSGVQDFEDVARLDTQYTDNWSLKLDFEILFKTVAVVFMQDGGKMTLTIVGGRRSIMMPSELNGKAQTVWPHFESGAQLCGISDKYSVISLCGGGATRTEKLAFVCQYADACQQKVLLLDECGTCFPRHRAIHKKRMCQSTVLRKNWGGLTCFVGLLLVKKQNITQQLSAIVGRSLTWDINVYLLQQNMR